MKQLTVITTRDFDEIILNNPFLDDENKGFGFVKFFWWYDINYNEAQLNFPGQSNSTSKYIILKNNLSGTTFKIIREDDHVKITEIFPDKNDTETVADAKKLKRIKRRFNVLKRLIKKKIKKHYRTISKIEKIHFNSNPEATRKFLQLIRPELSPDLQEETIRALKLAGQNPSEHFDTSDTFHYNEKQIGQLIYIRVLLSQLRKNHSLLVIDWKSPFDEVAGLFLPVLKKLEIPAHLLNKEPENYHTIQFLAKLSKHAEQYGKKFLLLGGVSDTYHIAVSDTRDFNQATQYGKKIGLEVTGFKE